MNTQLIAWLACCPLRRWRLRQTPEWGRLRLARTLGVSKWAVILWELGRRKSTEDRWQEVYRLTGITWNEWEEWYGFRLSTKT
jgi:hypothetical protein